MPDCKNCAGGGCGSCGAALELGPMEAQLLQKLGQFSFLPVARKADDMTPIYREDTDFSESDYSLIIRLLEKKQLIYLDYTPLKGADMSRYTGYPVHGSMALTARGQQVLEQLERTGAIGN